MKIDIFGLGAIGSNLFVQLVRQFPDWEYVGVDFDKVEGRNLRTQAYFKEHVGLTKAAALRTVGLRYVNNLKYVPMIRKIEQAQFDVGGKDCLWVDCFDNAASRRLLTPKVGNVLHLGFSPLYSAECIWNEKYEVPGDVDAKQGDICSMTDAVGFIHSFVGLAVMTISEWAKSGRKLNFLITGKTKLRWL